MNILRIALVSINNVVGDINGNSEKIIKYLDNAHEKGVDLVVFPELAITGYPPEDLLLKPEFINANKKSLQDIASSVNNLTAIVGFVDREEDIYNAAAVLHDGKIAGIYRKHYLPNYAIFDEYRYFKPGSEYPVFQIGSFIVGINICEDLWYPEGPAMIQSLSGDAQVIVNINASPYHASKIHQRQRMLATRATDNRVFIAWTNLVGGQDELVFDGTSMVFGPLGQLLVMGKQFQEEMVVADLDMTMIDRVRLHDPRRRIMHSGTPKFTGSVPLVEVAPKRDKHYHRLPMKIHPPLDQLEEIYEALCLGTRDYVTKNGFSKVVIGISGGVDSAVTAVIAMDAIGSDNVIGVLMPSLYTTNTSIQDAEKICKNLNIKLVTIPIDNIFKTYLSDMEKVFKDTVQDVTEENIQARIRGNILMALSNKFGWLVLTTGNKSEMAVGYATLYGDMAGGFAVLKDVPKTMVYQLAKYKNNIENNSIIPESILMKPPSAELKHNQVDQDSLPPYDILDPIIKAYVEEDRSLDDIVSLGFEKNTVENIIRMIDKSEYKRRQSPPGIRITPRAFGKDRRLPITNKYNNS